MSNAPMPGPGLFRPVPKSMPPVAPLTGGGEFGDGGDDQAVRGSGHPAVDAALQAIVNAADLSPADQIAQYEAAHQTLRETLATIDQA